jgi:hypothetical protein
VRDYPTPEQLRPKQREMLDYLSDLRPHTVEEMWLTPAFAGTRRHTLQEIVRLLRGQGYDIASPESKLARPYWFRLLSKEPVTPREPRRCPTCHRAFDRHREAA